MTYRETEKTLARMLDALDVKVSASDFIRAADTLTRQARATDRMNLAACNGIMRWNDSRRVSEPTWTDDDESRREAQRSKARAKIREVLESLGLKTPKPDATESPLTPDEVHAELQGDPRGAAIILHAAGREWRF